MSVQNTQGDLIQVGAVGNFNNLNSCTLYTQIEKFDRDILCTNFISITHV